MKIFRSICQFTFAAFLLAMLLAAPSPAAARDRPGTPNHERAYECWDIPGLPKHFDGPPMICVMFTNAASEEVRFETEWTANGVKLSQDDFKNRIECAKLTASYYPGGTQCVAGWNLMGYPVTSYVGQVVDWRAVGYRLSGQSYRDKVSLPGESFLVKNLEFDTDYCFRFRSRDADNDLVSELWSNWACAHTDIRPPQPKKPEIIKAEFVPAEWDGSSKSKPVPNHIFIQWNADPDHVAYFTLAQMNRFGKVTENRVDGSSKSIEVSPAELAEWNQIKFYACAHNMTGVACSATATTSPVRGVESNPNIDLTQMTNSARDAVDTRPPNLEVKLPHDDGRDVALPRANVTTAVAQPAVPSNACAAGFVWRKAQTEDRVCVTPAARTRVARENADASAHVNPNGAYGPNTCNSGFVWRTAYVGDVVCVTPEARALALEENRVAPSRYAN